MNPGKISLSLSLFLIGSSALACPDLTGNYISGNKRMELRVSKDASGTFSFAAGGPAMILNGQTHAIPGQTGFSYVGSCAPNEISVRIFQGTSEIGKMNYRAVSNGVHETASGFVNSDEIYVRQ